MTKHATAPASPSPSPRVGSPRLRPPARALALPCVLLACAPLIRPGLPAQPPRRALRVDVAETLECQRLSNRFDLPLAGPVDDPALLPYLDDVPPEVRRIAQAAGLEPLLAARLRARDDADLPAALALDLDLVRALSSLEIQLAALLFEAECVGNQMEALLREHEGDQRVRELTLAVTSVLLGAAAATAAGVWELRGADHDGPAVLAIAGGAASATLGLAAFVPERRAVLYPHPRNLLAPIAAGADPDGLYPTFVLRLLTAPSLDDRPTPHQELLRDWRRLLEAHVPPSRRALAERVLYGHGGVYDADLIDLREQMFDVLESHLNSLYRDLELLYRFTDRLRDPSR